MHKVRLAYTLDSASSAQRDLHHPLLALLAAVHDGGSIGGAARALERSYRHVWGELKRWEGELGQTLVEWIKGDEKAQDLGEPQWEDQMFISSPASRLEQDGIHPKCFLCAPRKQALYLAVPVPTRGMERPSAFSIIARTLSR